MPENQILFLRLDWQVRPRPSEGAKSTSWHRPALREVFGPQDLRGPIYFHFMVIGSETSG